MPKGFPCPNPTCTHVFPPESVQGAAALTCPDCGTTFQFRAAAKPGGRTGLKQPHPTAMKPPAPAPRRTGIPPAPPPAPSPPPPMAAVVPAAVPPMPVATPAPAADLEPAEEIIPRHSLRRRRGEGGCGYAVATVLVGLVGLTVVALAGWLIINIFTRLPVPGSEEEASPGPAHDSKLYNFRFVYPPAPWRTDPDTRQKLHTGFAWRRTEPNAWLAVLAKDYKTRTPEGAELLEDAERHLQSYFHERLEWERKPDGELAGRRALHLEFVGEVNSVPMTGDCYALAANGIGYWFLTWAPTAEQAAVADEWDGIRRGFSLLHEREGWTEKQAKILTLQGARLRYTLGYAEGTWEKQDEPAAYDPAADAALLGRDQNHPQDTDKTATALVLLLPGQATLQAAAAAARAHVLAQEKKLYAETTLEDADAKDKTEDRPPDEIGNTRGRILRLRAKVGDSLEHFVYLAVVHLPGQTVAIQCECDSRRRTYWEANFNQLVRRFTLKR